MLATAAARHMESHFEWYRRLSAQERSWVGVIAQSGFSSFVTWYADTDRVGKVTAEAFKGAPRELTRSISLRQTLDLIHTVVDVVEEHIDDLAAPGSEADLAFAVLRYSRDIAFAAARIYAGAAESRGAWDARLESLVVDAVLRGEADDELSPRANALGWGDVSPVLVAAGSTPLGGADAGVPAVRRHATRLGLECLASVQGRRLVLIIGGRADARDLMTELAEDFGDGPVVIGPTVPHLFAAGRSARAALAGLRGAAGWPAAPRPVFAEDLLPERVLIGDGPARRTLIDRVYRPLRDAGGGLLDTATEFVERGRAVEATARAMFVHPNTVRYRLARITDLIAYDLSQPRDAYVVQLALALGRVEGQARRSGRWTVSASFPVALGGPDIDL